MILLRGLAGLSDPVTAINRSIFFRFAAAYNCPMDPLAALPQPVVDALARGQTILTGNQRAVRTLRRLFDLRQHALGLTFWQPPNILAWDSWLTSQWHRLLLEGHANALLLNSTQEHALWRSIIAADPGASSLRPLDSLADLASDAWKRLHTYGGQRRLHAMAGTTDTRAFARWAAEFERRCLRAQYITAAQLPEALAAAITASQTAPSTGLLLSGFDLTTPAQAALLEALRNAGTEISELGIATSLSQPTELPLLLDAPDSHSEILACARWLRTQLTNNPAAQLAVIVPDIASERAIIDRAFRSILAPELHNIAATTANAPYEFSLGVPLDRTPIAALALDLLHWCAGPLPLDRISALLLSPHFAHGRQDSELLARAEFDAFTLRDRPLLEPRLTIDDLASLVSRAKQSSQLPLLLAGLRALIATVRRTALSRDRTHAEWAAGFQQILDAVGWAPVANLDSIEFQTRSKWESALDELSTLDFGPQTPRVTFRAALDALARIAAQTLFAPESRHAPIQIMGPLESAGSSFHAVWFLRAGDLTWPPVPATNPLLPYSLQRDFAMPGADPHADTAHASRITHRIAASASEVVFSYALQTSDGHQRPSPVLSELHLEARAATEILPDDPAPVPIPLDRLLDTTPIPSPPATTLRGGASILEAQAACAFRAFAERRLFSSSPDEVSLGLDARDRGSIVHSVLHEFWLQVRTQSALRSMTTPDRDALLAQSIHSALARDHSRPAAGWPTAYIDAERERLLRLLRPWLDFEANTRPPFVVKSSEEQIQGVPIGPLHLDIRVDRVDETVPAPGQQPAEIILDYKTGSADPARWEGDRPDTPQLPLYAVVSPAPHLAAVAFATIRPGKFMGLSGLQSQDGILPRAKRGQTLDLEAKREEWRHTLVSLAEEFHSGRAIPSPKDYPHTCRYCRQRLLCRLDPSSFTQHDEPDPNDITADAPSAFSQNPETQP